MSVNLKLHGQDEKTRRISTLDPSYAIAWTPKRLRSVFADSFQGTAVCLNTANFKLQPGSNEERCPKAALGNGLFEG
tara:strand:+ start:197 stop:427 length:231 start_codon:yes stop_codon:yes gene_type:complete